MKAFGLQLYTLRDSFQTPEGVKESFRKMAEYGYTEGQTAGTYDFMPAETFASYAAEAGISICGTHYNWDMIRDDPARTVAYHRALGTTNVGIGGMPGGYARDREGVLRFCEDANRIADRLHGEGFRFTYHNHAFEFIKTADGKTLMDLLIENLDPEKTSFVLDTYWVQHGGYDILKMIRRLKGRIDILHLKDMGAWHPYRLENGQTIYAPYITEIGAGNICFEDIIPVAEECGVKHFVVEQDTNFAVDPFESIRTSADYIRAHLMEQ